MRLFRQQETSVQQVVHYTFDGVERLSAVANMLASTLIHESSSDQDILKDEIIMSSTFFYR